MVSNIGGSNFAVCSSAGKSSFIRDRARDERLPDAQSHQLECGADHLHLDDWLELQALRLGTLRELTSSRVVPAEVGVVDDQ